MIIACSTHQGGGASRPTGFQSYQKIGGTGEANNDGTRGLAMLNHGSGSGRNVIHYFEGRITAGTHTICCSHGWATGVFLQHM